jgi:hypothetical protein
LIIIFLPQNHHSTKALALSPAGGNQALTGGKLSLHLISMEPATTRVHNLTAEGMEFTITETVRASTVEKWLHAVKERFLDAAPIKCVGLDYEFTTPKDKPHQRTALLQLSVASEVLLFQLCRADHV